MFTRSDRDPMAVGPRHEIGRQYEYPSRPNPSLGEKESYSTRMSSYIFVFLSSIIDSIWLFYLKD